MLARFRAALTAPVDIASLVAFRIGFGLLMSAAMIRSLALGFVRDIYVAPAFHFGFVPWVRPWPAWGMYAHFAVLAVLALGVAAGWRYRFCAAAFFLGFTYVEMLDRAAYLNHYYLVSLLVALIAVLPLHRAASLDARRRPSLRTDRVAAGCLYVLQAQLAVVYLFAGLAKLNADWLVQAQPLRIWLAARAELPVLAHPATAHLASWAGAIFDLTIVPLLLARRTRPFAYAALVLFHLLTAALFPIGLFPWLMILSATLFFSPDWPRRFLRRRALAPTPAAAVPVPTPAAAVPVPTPAAAVPVPTPAAAVPVPTPAAAVPVPALLALHCLLQLAIPLWLHLRYPDGAWTGRGFNFAWKVMVAEKTGHVFFHLRDPRTGASRRIDPTPLLSPLQALAMPQDPDMIRAFARHLAGSPPLEVRADAFATLNGRPSARLIDPAVDLAADNLPAAWILPAPPP